MVSMEKGPVAQHGWSDRLIMVYMRYLLVKGSNPFGPTTRNVVSKPFWDDFFYQTCCRIVTFLRESCYLTGDAHVQQKLR